MDQANALRNLIQTKATVNQKAQLIILTSDKDKAAIINGLTDYFSKENKQVAVLDKENDDLTNNFTRFEQMCDIIILDASKGIEKQMINLVKASDGVVVITAPEPNSMVSSYGLIKMSKEELTESNFGIIINRVRDEREGGEVFERLQTTADEFLNVKLNYLGWLPQETYGLFAKSVAEIGMRILIAGKDIRI